jgi:predicted permease
VPGVEIASLASGGLPLRGDLKTQDFSIPGSVPPQTGDIALNEVSPDYFGALKIPLLQGRGFSDADRQGATPVMILNRRAAQTLFGAEGALGKAVLWKGAVGERTVVGVVGDIRFDGPENDVRPQAFIPFAQSRSAGATLVVRTAPGGTSLPDIARAIGAEFPAGVMPPLHMKVQTIEQYLADLVAHRRLNMLLLGVFGILGISIASIGIYGVMAYIVAQRTHEIGIRMALGALPAAILWAVVARTVRCIGLGIGVGLVGAWMLSETVSGFLFDIRPHDPAVYLMVGTLLVTIGLTAALIPARRAARVDPLVALRFE